MQPPCKKRSFASTDARAEILSPSHRPGPQCTPKSSQGHAWRGISHSSDLALQQHRRYLLVQAPSSASGPSHLCHATQSCSAHLEGLHKPRRTWKCLQPFIYIIPGSRNWKGKLCSPAVRTPVGNKSKRSAGQAMAMEWYLLVSEATRQGTPHNLFSCLQPTGQLQIQ